MASDKLDRELLARRRLRRAREPRVIASWTNAGYRATALSHAMHEQFLGQFRSSGTTRKSLEGSLLNAIVGLVQSSDLLVVIGWNVDEEPALLLQSDALDQSEAFLRAIYPDGFVAASHPFTRALIVDFDEYDVETDEVVFSQS